MHVVFREKEYTPIGPKPDPVDSHPRFASKDFDAVYAKVANLQALKNELWTGINAGALTRHPRRRLESAL